MKDCASDSELASAVLRAVIQPCQRGGSDAPTATIGDRAFSRCGNTFARYLLMSRTLSPTICYGDINIGGTTTAVRYKIPMEGRFRRGSVAKGRFGRHGSQEE